MANEKSERNKTVMLNDYDMSQYGQRLIAVEKTVTTGQILNKTINQNISDVADFLPESFVDLMFLDPPYNLDKSFNGKDFKKTSIEQFNEYLDSWLPKLIRLLKPSASVYICGDWYTSTSIHLIASKYLNILNRITWQREKGRGAKSNWKNSSEDIWFCTAGPKYKFYVDRVKEKRKVIAPYKVDGKPKDWEESEHGNFRLTHPSNIWTDLSVPYWSMAENTEHPTQKPEKLLAKIILAGSDEGDVIFDPFLGSGTTSVVAKKLGRNYVGVEMDLRYACLAEKRLESAETDKTIQGYEDGVFWERNSLAFRRKKKM